MVSFERKKIAMIVLEMEVAEWMEAAWKAG